MKRVKKYSKQCFYFVVKVKPTQQLLLASFMQPKKRNSSAKLLNREKK